MMTGTSILHIASRYPHGLLGKLLAYSHMKALIDAPDNKGATPLIVAVWYENLETVRLLLKTGAKTRNSLHESGKTALHIASSLKDETILDEILKYNDSPYFLDAFDKSGNTALLTSAMFDTKCSQSLLKAGANHHDRNKNTGRNILHLAVLYQRRELVEFLVTAYPEIAFITALDANGDSPLKLALELKDTETVMILLQSVAGEKLVDDFPDSLIMAIRIGKEELFDQVLKLSSIDRVTSYCNDEGETALSVAASNGLVVIVERLLQSGVKPFLRGKVCSKSIIGSIIENLNNVCITKLLLDAMHEELSEASDRDTKDLYEAILRRSSLGNFIVFQQSVLFDRIDDSHESPLFYIVRTGNYGALLALLLSRGCSQRDWISFSSGLPSEIDLLRLYLKQELYASDIYILTGTLPDNPRSNLHPPQDHLFENNSDNRNIFHACALGGNLNSVIFVYEYCEIFHPKECKKLDESDSTGSTPLLLAILNKSQDVAAYLVQKGANLIKHNLNGESPIQAIAKHIPEHQSLLIDLMTQCIVSEQNIISAHGQIQHPRFSLHMYLLHPKNAKNVTDVGFEICKLDYFKYQNILCHPLLDYFVWYLWEEIGQLMRIRFYIGTCSTVFFSVFVTLKYCIIVPPYWKLLQTVFWWLSIWFAKLCLLFHLPICYVHARFIRRLMLMSTVVTPVLEITYLILYQQDEEDRTSLEIGGTAILAAWLSLLFHGVATPDDGIQIMTFWMIFQEMCVVLPTFCIISFAFTLYFFTLFNGYLMFNNPMHSFLFTAFQIPQGSIDILPSLYDQSDEETFTFANSTAEDFGILDGTINEPVLMKLELRTMIVEGMTVLFYLLASTALTNMLTALAIRAGEEHLMAKPAKTTARKMSRIHEWEEFVNSKFYTFLYKCKALWIVGVHPKLKEIFAVPQVMHPVKTTEGYDIFRMKKFLMENEDLLSNKEIPYLLQLLRDEFQRNSET
ncbi:hypothetical protein GE061_004390 [Apolygus lucorum]|uniref:Ion transport domain-containing protein n=1 Tax=Apolygus lucorum TaxID=248454 RepID=A0A8S9X0K2_APOLU|nr:hypothetical protein GE061_004390 [Apolygus lucorum]